MIHILFRTSKQMYIFSSIYRVVQSKLRWSAEDEPSSYSTTSANRKLRFTSQLHFNQRAATGSNTRTKLFWLCSSYINQGISIWSSRGLRVPRHRILWYDIWLWAGNRNFFVFASRHSVCITTTMHLCPFIALHPPPSPPTRRRPPPPTVHTVYARVKVNVRQQTTNRLQRQQISAKTKARGYCTGYIYPHKRHPESRLFTAV